MSRYRLLLAVAAAALVWVSMAAPAGAGQAAVTIDDTVECNLGTGEYDITLTLENFLDEVALIDVLTFQVDGVDAPLPVFSPDPLPSLGTSTAVVSIPGDSTSIFLEVDADFEQFTSELSLESTLEGDCEPAPTTTTTSTTLAPTTTTTAPAARPLAITPAFTG